MDATDVPPNITSIIWDDLRRGPGPTLIHRATGDEVTLVPDGQGSDSGAVTRYRIVGELLPSTAYEVRDSTGATMPFFTTGAMDDVTPPPPPSLASFGIHKELGDGDCATERIDVVGALVLPEAAVLHAQFRTPGRADQTFALDPELGFRSLGGGCKVRIEVDTATDVTVTVWTTDLAGNRSAEVSATTRVDGCGFDECVDDGGCSTGGAGAGGLVGLLALGRRRRRVA